MESLGNSPAFLDGSKRSSFAAPNTILRANGCFLDVDSHEAYKFIEGLIQSVYFASL